MHVLILFLGDLDLDRGILGQFPVYLSYNSLYQVAHSTQPYSTSNSKSAELFLQIITSAVLF